MHFPDTSLVTLLGEDEDPFSLRSAEGIAPIDGSGISAIEPSQSFSAGLSMRDSCFEVVRLADEEGTTLNQSDFPIRRSSVTGLGLSSLIVPRPYKGQRAVKWENFATSLGRALKKAIKICNEMKVNGEQPTIDKYKKLHAVRKQWVSLVPVIVNSRSEESLRRLYRHFLDTSVDHSIDRFAKTYTGPSRTDGHSKEAKVQARPAQKTWNFDFQRAFYSSPGIRIFYYFFIQFLDYFGDSGEGVRLCHALNISADNNSPESVKCGYIFSYLRELGLDPYDGTAFAPVFYIIRS